MQSANNCQWLAFNIYTYLLNALKLDTSGLEPLMYIVLASIALPYTLVTLRSWIKAQLVFILTEVDYAIPVLLTWLWTTARACTTELKTLILKSPDYFRRLVIWLPILFAMASETPPTPNTPPQRFLLAPRAQYTQDQIHILSGVLQTKGEEHTLNGGGLWVFRQFSETEKVELLSFLRTDGHVETDVRRDGTTISCRDHWDEDIECFAQALHEANLPFQWTATGILVPRSLDAESQQRLWAQARSTSSCPQQCERTGVFVGLHRHLARTTIWFDYQRHHETAAVVNALRKVNLLTDFKYRRGELVLHRHLRDEEVGGFRRRVTELEHRFGDGGDLTARWSNVNFKVQSGCTTVPKILVSLEILESGREIFDSVGGNIVIYRELTRSEAAALLDHTKKRVLAHLHGLRPQRQTSDKELGANERSVQKPQSNHPSHDIGRHSRLTSPKRESNGGSQSSRPSESRAYSRRPRTTGQAASAAPEAVQREASSLSQSSEKQRPIPQQSLEPVGVQTTSTKSTSLESTSKSAPPTSWAKVEDVLYRIRLEVSRMTEEVLVLMDVPQELRILAAEATFKKVRGLEMAMKDHQQKFLEFGLEAEWYRLAQMQAELVAALQPYLTSVFEPSGVPKRSYLERFVRQNDLHPEAMDLDSPIADSPRLSRPTKRPRITASSGPSMKEVRRRHGREAAEHQQRDINQTCYLFPLHGSGLLNSGRLFYNPGDDAMQWEYAPSPQRLRSHARREGSGEVLRSTLDRLTRRAILIAEAESPIPDSTNNIEMLRSLVEADLPIPDLIFGLNDLDDRVARRSLTTLSKAQLVEMFHETYHLISGVVADATNRRINGHGSMEDVGLIIETEQQAQQVLAALASAINEAEERLKHAADMRLAQLRSEIDELEATHSAIDVRLPIRKRDEALARTGPHRQQEAENALEEEQSALLALFNSLVERLRHLEPPLTDGARNHPIAARAFQDLADRAGTLWMSLQADIDVFRYKPRRQITSDCRPELLHSLTRTVARGLLPSPTSGEGLLCGIRALVMSLHALNAFYENLNADDVMRRMYRNFRSYQQHGELTREFSAFLVRRDLTHPEAVATFQDLRNFSIDSLATFLDFMVDVDILVPANYQLAVIYQQAHDGPWSAYRHDLAREERADLETVTVWIYNDNAADIADDDFFRRQRAREVSAGLTHLIGGIKSPVTPLGFSSSVYSHYSGFSMEGGAFGQDLAWRWGLVNDVDPEVAKRNEERLRVVQALRKKRDELETVKANADADAEEEDEGWVDFDEL